MAAAGTKTMTAKLSVAPDQEMKKDAKEYVTKTKVKKIKTLYSKPITYEEKIDLNPKKWDEKKLSKAMAVLVRPELQLMAQRVADYKKKADKDKSLGGEIKMIGALEDIHKKIVKKIEESCANALEDLASGKSEAKAGIAQGKKAMAQINKLNIDDLFNYCANDAMEFARLASENIQAGDEKDTQVFMAMAHKQTLDTIKLLGEEGKQAQNVAKFLLSIGKKLKGHENGQLADFGARIMKDDVQPELAKLDSDMDKLEKELTSFAAEFKGGKMSKASADKWQKDFKQMKSMQKTADKAEKAMKSLQADFKKIEKDLK